MKYFKGKAWDEITREERFFCAELYFRIKNDINRFLEKFQITSGYDYKVGYEVCFYRDILKEYDLDNYSKKYDIEFSLKRTFDLVLFSESEIYLFEAKCQQGFTSDQLDKIYKDRCYIKMLFEKIQEERKKDFKIPTVKIGAIVSDKYYKNKKVKGKMNKIFCKTICWNEIYELYDKNEVFERANSIFGK